MGRAGSRKQLKTTVSHGTVTLEGKVAYWTQRLDAERAIERLAGVKCVINRIEVKPREHVNVEEARKGRREGARAPRGTRSGAHRPARHRRRGERHGNRPHLAGEGSRSRRRARNSGCTVGGRPPPDSTARLTDTVTMVAGRGRRGRARGNTEPVEAEAARTLGSGDPRTLTTARRATGCLAGRVLVSTIARIHAGPHPDRGGRPVSRREPLRDCLHFRIRRGCGSLRRGSLGRNRHRHCRPHRHGPSTARHERLPTCFRLSDRTVSGSRP